MAVTTMDILVDYLNKRRGESVASHDVEMAVPRHGELHFLRTHNGGTYSRKFRELRESNELQQAVGLSFKELPVEKGREKRWNILLNTPSVGPMHVTPFVF